MWLGYALLIGDAIGVVLELIGSSIYLQVGFVLVLIAIVLSAINGLIEIAFYIALITGVILLLLGGLHWVDPGLVPLHLFDSDYSHWLPSMASAGIGDHR